jgi:formylglycine-generating enzyme required for sulfatase activity
MAPEQTQDAKTVDGRADIYSLGCTLYHLLAGEPPFANLVRSAVLAAHQIMQPKSLTEYRADLEPALLELLQKMMAKKREERLATALEVARILEPFTVPPKSVAIAPAAPPTPRYDSPKYERLPGKEYLENSIGMVFVKIPAGKFVMGSPLNEQNRFTDEHQHQVQLTQPLYIGIFTVTQEQYARVMKHGTGYRLVKDNGEPMVWVTWHDALRFCKLLSNLEAERQAGRTYRLPTEAEWEYACRSGAASYSAFHYGTALTSDLANFDGNFPYPPYGTLQGANLEWTTPVGSYQPNNFGLYDMHGNVWEWCADWYDAGYYKNSPRNDPENTSVSTKKVLRGGCWKNRGSDCRSAHRGRREPETPWDHVGFRVAAVLSDH